MKTPWGFRGSVAPVHEAMADLPRSVVSRTASDSTANLWVSWKLVGIARGGGNRSRLLVFQPPLILTDLAALRPVALEMDSVPSCGEGVVDGSRGVPISD